MKTGHVEKTTDREYEAEERRYRTLEAASLRLQKEAKGYLDSLRAMTASQMRIAETIDAFYGDSGAKDGVSRSYKQAVEDLDAETVKALDGPYRCVPTSLYKHAEDEDGTIDQTIIEEVEKEWNFKAGNRRVYTTGIIGGRDCTGFRRASELMDYIYRTTVLEPINRFCAYFPDINECESFFSMQQEAERHIDCTPGIKKRQHKMLDYDAMRSKVRKLTEKPDKDPGKLPRTEKEADMVSMKDFLDDSTSLHTLTNTSEHGQAPSGAFDYDLEADLLEMPSPPKVLQRPEIQKLKQGEKPERVSSMSLDRSPSMLYKVAKVKSPRLGAASDEAMLQRTSSGMASTTATSSFSSEYNGEDGRTSTDGLLQHSSSTPSCSFSMPSSSSSSTITTMKSHPDKASRGSSETTTRCQGASRSALGRGRGRSTHQILPTPFFQPSELEDLMQPLREEFMKREADNLKQAKAAYEQLNDQLTSELPQLIDLRYSAAACR